MRTPDRAEARITKCNLPALFKRPDYVEYDEHANQVGVHCRYCGTKVKGWVDWERTSEGKVRQRFIELGNYVEVPFLLDDGSFMFVAMCKDCQYRVKPDDYDALYACELASWAASIKRRNMSQEFMDAYMDKMGDKHIIRVADRDGK